MADFCKQCSIELFGDDFRDLAELVPPGGEANVICEGCGYTTVDSDGMCMHHPARGTSAECLGLNTVTITGKVIPPGYENFEDGAGI